MKLIKEFLQVFSLGANLKNKTQQCMILSICALLLFATSTAMTVINILHGFHTMTVITTILSVVFLVCAYLSGILKMEIIPSGLAAICVLFIFSYFAVSGQNEGFAILWILLIPLFSTSIFEMRISIITSAYFLLFSIVLFYTPLRELVREHYSQAFMERFPVLYICALIISIFLFLQKEFYSRKLSIKANVDELTGVYNRSYFTHFILHAPLSAKSNTCLMLIDINGLKEINDNLGHEAGDELICAFPQCCQQILKSDFTLCRIGGDEFVLILYQPEEEIASVVKKLKECGSKWSGTYSKGCAFSVGWASSSIHPDDTIIDLFRIADSEMYQDKARYYQQAGKDRRKSRRDDKK